MTEIPTVSNGGNTTTPEAFPRKKRRVFLWVFSNPR